MAIESHPARAGRSVTGHAGSVPGNGPFMRVTLHVSEGWILEASYETYQCPACHDCGRAVCELSRGTTVERAGEIRHEHIVEKVGPLPQSRSGCYGLAVLALSDALQRLLKPEDR